MKKQKKNKVASLLLALALILTCGVAGTIAQYQKSFGGTATANVAKFKVSATGINANKVKLFDSVLDTDATGNYEEKDVVQNKIAPGTVGFVELSVTNESEVSIDYKIDLSKVYSGSAGAGTAGDGWHISYTKDDTTTATGEIPLEFALYTAGAVDLGNSTTTAQQKGQAINGISTWYSLDDLKTNSASDLKGTINLTDGNTPKKVYLCWRWAHTSATDTTNRNLLDTAIGEDMASGSPTINPQLKVTLTATQKN